MFGKFSPKIKTRHNGFTLAEVLITLTIVGVIAAITVPNLIANNEKQTTAVKVKKTYNILANAIKLSEIDNGPMKEWDVYTSSTENTEKALKKYILPYIKIAKECPYGKTPFSACNGLNTSSHAKNYLLLDGVHVSFYYYHNPNEAIIYLAITPNTSTAKRRNENTPYPKDGKDWFYFIINDGKIKPYCSCAEAKRNDRDYLLTKCATETNNTSQYYCTALFYIDGFEFKKDYPW